MTKKKFSSFDRIMFLSLAFSLVLIIVRIAFSGNWTFAFIAWNLLLAVIPYLLSTAVNAKKVLNEKAIIQLLCWLLFLPNAPYILTDLFHLDGRPPIPLWYDLMVLASAALNGLILAIASLLQVEHFLRLHFKRRLVNAFIIGVLFLCSYGIYLGRFLRFNSWDIISNPIALATSIFYSLIHPFQHTRTWGFSLLFACLLSLAYYAIKTLAMAAEKDMKHV